eukprot:SAG22_NODE_8341_length_663_cov_0.726950_1_plen_172_part_10
MDYANGHGNNEDCRWTAVCTSGVPTITFTVFNTEGNYDFVNVYDGDTTDAERIARLHGSSVPGPVVGTGSTVVVQFTSDGSVTRDGFHAELTCGEPPNFNYLGCYNDNNGGRDLEHTAPRVTGGGPETIAACSARCSDYSYFGLQWANECFCGNTYGSQGENSDCGGASASS